MVKCRRTYELASISKKEHIMLAIRAIVARFSALTAIYEGWLLIGATLID